jgi:hypothetical protein
LPQKREKADTMTRSILAAFAATIAVTVLAGTGGCNSTGVGDPCTPEAEYDPAFLGFDAAEVNVEEKSFQCETRLCLANHFQGRVTCPYGQASTGTAAATTAYDGTKGTTGCITPTLQPVTGLDPTTGVVASVAGQMPGAVLPQCADRTAAEAVYCSCRCANVDGQTNDGSNYCSCPTGFSCTQLVSSVGAGTDPGLVGAYCIKNATAFDPNNSCSTECAAATGGCGTAQGVSK